MSSKTEYESTSNPPQSMPTTAQSPLSTSGTSFPPVRACIFDMDGLLLDTEDIYTLCTNVILAENSRPPLPWSIKAQLQGRPGPAASAIFQAWARLPLSPPAYHARLSELQREHFPHAQPLPGVRTLLQTLARTQDTSRPVELALATSSHQGNFALKTAHLPDVSAHFGERRRVLGDDARVRPGRGKPAPDIYLVALAALNEGRSDEERIRPDECLVLEDSVPGVEAGRRAGMRVVWVPHAGLAEEYRGREGLVLAGRAGDESEEESSERGGVVGSVGDGWAVQLKSLEEFPYEMFGIDVRGK